MSMKSHRSIIARGFLQTGDPSSTQLSAPLPWNFMPLKGACTQCCSCGDGLLPQTMELNGLAADELLAWGGGARGKLPVVITIQGNKIGSVFWYSLLLPLTGFILGAIAGQSMLHSEIAAIIGAVTGLVLCSGITKSIPADTLAIEPANNHKTSEIID